MTEKGSKAPIPPTANTPVFTGLDPVIHAHGTRTVAGDRANAEPSVFMDGRVGARP